MGVSSGFFMIIRPAKITTFVHRMRGHCTFCECTAIFDTEIAIKRWLDVTDIAAVTNFTVASASQVLATVST